MNIKSILWASYLTVTLLACPIKIYSMNQPPAAQECQICFESYGEEHEQAVLKCGHFFGKNCIEEWAEKSDTCPVCNDPLEFSIMAAADHVNSYYNPEIHTVSECSICREEYKKNQEITILPCSNQHIFHDKCLNPHIIAKGDQAACPLCNAPIPLDSKIMYESGGPRPDEEGERLARQLFAKEQRKSSKWDKHYPTPAYHYAAPVKLPKQQAAHKNYSTFIALEFFAAMLVGLLNQQLWTQTGKLGYESQKPLAIALSGASLLATHKLLNKINPNRTEHLGKLLACWGTGLGVGAFGIPYVANKAFPTKN